MASGPRFSRTSGRRAPPGPELSGPPLPLEAPRCKSAAVGKGITRWNPLHWSDVDEYERHYQQVHTVFVRANLRYGDIGVSYHIDRVLRQRDVAGGWAQRPRAWRFAITRTRDVPLTGAGGAIPEVLRHQYDVDHTNFLRDLRSCQCEEVTVLDRLTGQTALDKYLLEIDRRPGISDDEAWAGLRPRLDDLHARAADAFGARLVIENRVRAEAETGPVEAPGQRFGPDQFRPETDKVAYVEWYFDHYQWGDEFFADAAETVDAILWDPAYSVAALYHVEERGGVDKR